MNSISLAAAAEKKKKPKKFGLTTTNVFGNDNDDSSSEEEESSNPVNRELLREQAALRQRAATAMKYDFDGTYQEQKEETKKAAEPKKESRYIADMMKKAKQRNFERDIAHERKIAKEQEAEDVGDDKEKFITSAYKKKLKERELWKEEQEEEQRRDTERDVTKRKDGVAGFYSNFNRNVAVGGDEAPADDKPSFLDGFETAAPTEESNKDDAGEDDARPSFLDGFEAPNAAKDMASEATEDRKRKLDVTQDDATPKKSMLEIRQEKVAAARLRYFARRGITEQQALQESY